MYVAGRMVLCLPVESHGTLVAVSAPFVMPCRDLDIPIERSYEHLDIPMNVPITFRNQQHFSLGYPITPTTHALLYIGVSRATSAQKKNGKQAQRHHPTSLSSQSGESLRHVGCYTQPLWVGKQESAW